MLRDVILSGGGRTLRFSAVTVSFRAPGAA